MTKNIHMKLKILGLFLLICLTLIFLIKTILIRNAIESSNASVIYDKNGDAIIDPVNQNLSIEKTPKIVLDYIEKDQSYTNIAPILYPDGFFNRIIGGFIVEHFYQENALKERYLSHLYFQNGTIGFQSAAKYYFNKTASELTEIESIYILSKTVSLASDNKLNLTLFIHNLYKDRLISKSQEIELTNRVPNLFESLYTNKSYKQSYIEYVIHELESILKMKEELIFQKGFNIYTNLDPKIQDILYSEVLNTNQRNNSMNTVPIETGIAIIDHHTGKIAGLLGGRKYQHSNLNRSYQITRQPASTFKPLIAFAPAIDSGWKPSDKLKDIPMRFGSFKPRNFDYIYRGEVTLKEALINSYNVPTTWLLNKIGLDEGIRYLDKMGLFQIDKKDGVGLALGFTSVGTSPIALAQAYSIFPNDGVMVNAHAVYLVKGTMGRTIFEVNQHEKKIITVKTARVMDNLLHSVVEEGTGNNAKINGQSIAGKTGTTSYDAWFVGYNKHYVAAIWMGPDEVTPKNRMDFGGGDSPALLFRNIFSNLD